LSRRDRGIDGARFGAGAIGDNVGKGIQDRITSGDPVAAIAGSLRPATACAIS